MRAGLVVGGALASNAPTVSEKIDAELRAQGGLVGELMNLCDTLQAASRDVVSGVRGLALVLDRERRGVQSVFARQDTVGVAKDVLGLVDTALLNDPARGAMLRMVAEGLAARGAAPAAMPSRTRKPRKARR